MKSQDLQKDEQYLYISPQPWRHKHVITYTGTVRDVKDLLHWFFRMSDGSTIFMCESEVEKLTEINNMCMKKESFIEAHNYSIQIIEGMGRGVISERDIKQGEIITKCEILVLSPSDTAKVNETNLEWYTFIYDINTKQDCLVLGDGEIFNHNDDANVLYNLIEWNGRKIMQFQASKDIKKGEQLFIDYRTDVEGLSNILEKYTTSLI